MSRSVIDGRVVCVAALLLGACGGPDGLDRTLEAVSLSSPAANGSIAPHLATAANGDAVMSWLEPVTADTHAVRFATLGTRGWSAPMTVIEGRGWFVNWADFPSVVPIAAERWAAHWLVKRPGGTYAYDIALALSADRGEHWTAPLTPHTDDTRTEHGFISLFPWSGGIGAVWLDGRNMLPDGSEPSAQSGEFGGMSLRYARIGYDGATLDEGEIDELVCDCCQTDVAMAAAGPVVAYRDRSAGEIRDIAVTRYVDGSWAEPITVSDDRWHIPGCPVNGPAIAADGDRVAVIWYGAPNRERRVKLAWSGDAGKTFAAPLIIDDGNVSGRVDVELVADDLAVVSWAATTADDAGELRARLVSADGTSGPIQVIATGDFSRRSGFPQMVATPDRLVFAWPEAGEPAQVLTAFASFDSR